MFKHKNRTFVNTSPGLCTWSLVHPPWMWRYMSCGSSQEGLSVLGLRAERKPPVCAWWRWRGQVYFEARGKAGAAKRMGSGRHGRGRRPASRRSCDRRPQSPPQQGAGAELFPPHSGRRSVGDSSQPENQSQRYCR